MFLLEKNSGLVIEELRNGFGGHEVTYFLWHGKRLIATSHDNKNWKMSGQWNDNKNLKPIDTKMYEALSRQGDV